MYAGRACRSYGGHATGSRITTWRGS
jgi:hypothetical protein